MPLLPFRHPVYALVFQDVVTAIEKHDGSQDFMRKASRISTGAVGRVLEGKDIWKYLYMLKACSRVSL